MANTNSKFFSVMVVGDNPREIMDKYDKSKTVEPYVKYVYLDAKKYKDRAIKAMEKIALDGDKILLPDNIKEGLKERLKTLKKLSDFDYYRELTDGLYYDNNGNALSDENPDGKWVTCRNGGHFSLPLILKDGTESYAARCKDVDWSSMHKVNQDIYKNPWELVMEGREPEDDEERKIYDVMKDRTVYFSNFKTKGEYVNYSTNYWNYAYVDENGWRDIDSENKGDEIKWINNFYETYVKGLKPDDLITIFECSVN